MPDNTLDNTTGAKREWIKGEVWKGKDGLLYIIVHKSKVRNSVITINADGILERVVMDQFETRVK